MKKILLEFLVLLMLISPLVVLAQGSIITATDCQQLPPNAKGEFAEVCDFQAFIALVNKVMNYIIVLSLPATAIVMAYAGFQLITAGDNESKRTEVKGMLWKVVIGFLFILSAWLIVKAITAPLLKEDYVQIL